MTIGDGHDLKSSRFAGDEVLEACLDKERVLRRGDSGPAVKKIQEALIFLRSLYPVPELMGYLGTKLNWLSEATRKLEDSRLMG